MCREVCASFFAKKSVIISLEIGILIMTDNFLVDRSTFSVDVTGRMPLRSTKMNVYGVECRGATPQDRVDSVDACV